MNPENIREGQSPPIQDRGPKNPSRRRFLKLAGLGTLAVAADKFLTACGFGGKASSEEPTLEPSPIRSPEQTPIPELPITPELLTGAFSGIDGAKGLAVIKATPEGKIEQKDTDWTELLGYSKKVWGEEMQLDQLQTDPIKALKFILSYVEWTGVEGSIDLSKTFSKLPLILSRVKIANLPNGQEYEAILNAFPQKLTIRKNTYMTTFGTFGSPSGPGAVVAFDDFLRNPNPDNIPRMFLGILPITLSLEQKDPGETSLKDLLTLNGGDYEGKEITLPNGEKVRGNTIESNFANKDIVNAVGVYFLDADPLRKNPDGTRPLHPNPIVPNPDRSIVGDTYGGVTQLEDGRAVALASDGKTPIARARYYPWKNNMRGEWEWVTGKEKIEYYSNRELEDGLGLEMGVMLSSFHILRPQFVGNEYLKLATENFNLVACPSFDWNNPYGYPLRPSQGKFDFTLPDASVEFATQNGMGVRGYHLVWGSKISRPPWLEEGNFSQGELLAIMEQHIKTVVRRYKGKVQEWSVVNELLGNYWQSGNSFWYDKLGTDFVGKAFQWAHEADADARLILNDTGMEIPGTTLYLPDRANKIYNLIIKLKEKDTPIHGIGFQMHLYGKDFATSTQLERNLESLRSSIRRFKNLGLDVSVTEFEMRIHDMPSYTLEERYDIQARASGAIYKTCLEEGVKGFTIWGLSDKYKDPLAGPDSAPLLFDEDLNPKPSFFAIKQVLSDAFLAKANQ